MIGPAVRTVFPDAAGWESRLPSPSLLRRRPQICQSHHQISVLSEVRRPAGSPEKLMIFFFFYTYWHEHDAVISPAKLSDTMQKHSRHLLVSVFNETENFKGETPHLTLPILKDCCLRIFIAPVWGKNDRCTHEHIHHTCTL